MAAGMQSTVGFASIDSIVKMGIGLSGWAAVDVCFMRAWHVKKNWQGTPSTFCQVRMGCT
jgi:hypothetical protein